MDMETSVEILKVRMFEMGHSWSDLENMNLENFGLVVGYWHEKGRVEAKRRRIQKNGRNS